MKPPSEEDLRHRFRAMTDAELDALVPSELTPVAMALLTAERELRRQTPREDPPPSRPDQLQARPSTAPKRLTALQEKCIGFGCLAAIVIVLLLLTLLLLARGRKVQKFVDDFRVPALASRARELMRRPPTNECYLPRPIIVLQGGTVAPLQFYLPQNLSPVPGARIGSLVILEKRRTKVTDYNERVAGFQCDYVLHLVDLISGVHACIKEFPGVPPPVSVNVVTRSTPGGLAGRVTDANGRVSDEPWCWCKYDSGDIEKWLQTLPERR